MLHGVSPQFANLVQARISRNIGQFEKTPSPVTRERATDLLENFGFAPRRKQPAQIVRHAPSGKRQDSLGASWVNQQGGQTSEPVAFSNLHHPQLVGTKSFDPGDQPFGALEWRRIGATIVELGPIGTDRT